MQSLIIPLIRWMMPLLLVMSAYTASSAQVSLHQSSVSESSATPQNINVPAANSTGSLNWAGYVAQKGNFYNAVEGTWKVPTVTTNTAESADATWVGVGGVAQRDLIQAGTEAIVDTDGSVTYQAWYELLPQYSIPVSLKVRAGDLIHTSITESSPDHWLIHIENQSTNQTFDKTVRYRSSHSSAEWVQEMVSNGDLTFRPLDSFGSVTFTGGSAMVDGKVESIQSSEAQPLTMVSEGGTALATTSALGSGGGSFSVSRTSAAADLASAGADESWYFVDSQDPSQYAIPIPIVVTFGRDGRDAADIPLGFRFSW